MDMIKKIAFTASTMLFVLAQIFSFYVIYINQKEKIDLLKEKEGKAFLRNIAEFSVDLQNINYNTFMEEYIVTYYFRENMVGENIHSISLKTSNKWKRVTSLTVN